MSSNKKTRNIINNGANYLGTQVDRKFIDNINNEINNTIEEIRKTVDKHYQPDVLKTLYKTKGFVAEDYLAGTFNADVAGKCGKNIEAFVIKKNDPIIDIIIENNKEISEWQVKYYKTALDTAKAISNPKYTGIGKIGPTEQLEGIQSEARRLALKNSLTREEMYNAYEDTSQNIKDKLYSDIYESKTLTEESSRKLVKDIYNDEFDPAEYNLTTIDFIDFETVLSKVYEAGANAAIVTAMLKLVPNLYTIISELINNGEIDMQQIKELGLSGLSASANGFIRGSVAASITLSSELGILGEFLKEMDPLAIGSATALAMNSMHNTFGLIKGELTPQEYAGACIRDIFISSFSYGGVILLTSITTKVLGVLLGNMLGSVIGIYMYNKCKDVALGLCINNGFSFFGVVKQNYRISKEILDYAGLNTFEPSKCTLNKYTANRVRINKYVAKKYIPSKIEMPILRRGIIGINEVGYI